MAKRQVSSDPVTRGFWQLGRRWPVAAVQGFAGSGPSRGRGIILNLAPCSVRIWLHFDIKRGQHFLTGLKAVMRSDSSSRRVSLEVTMRTTPTMLFAS